jgi:hypothetical protein
LTYDAPVVDGEVLQKVAEMFFAVQLKLREREEIMNGSQACFINRNCSKLWNCIEPIWAVQESQSIYLKMEPYCWNKSC